MSTKLVYDRWNKVIITERDCYILLLSSNLIRRKEVWEEISNTFKCKFILGLRNNLRQLEQL